MTDLGGVDGGSGTAVAGTWTVEGTAMQASSRQGAVEYTIAVEEAGVYRLQVAGTQGNPLGAKRYFTIDAHIDGVFTGTDVLDGPVGTTGTCRFYLPHLAAGSHTVRLNWRNLESDTFLKIVSLTLQDVGGPDVDQNGVADWLDHRLANSATLDEELPVTSAVSPACIEGKGLYTDLQKVLSSFIPEDNQLPVEDGQLVNTIGRGIANRWYANVPLAPDDATDITVSHQDGFATDEISITWTETNALLVSAITIRAGDALLLTAHPEGAENGTMAITVESQQLEPGFGTPVPYTFENTGDVTVSATYTPVVGDPVQNQMTVTVVGCVFNGTPACVVGQQRTWECPNVPDEAVIEHDDHLSVTEDVLEPAGRTLQLKLTQDREARIVARLGDGGPILAATKADPVTYSTSGRERFVVVYTYADGSQLVEARLSLGCVPADIEVRMHVMTSGVTFEDGTLDQTFTAAEFDENGELRYRLIRYLTGNHSSCHSIAFYQSDTYIGE